MREGPVTDPVTGPSRMRPWAERQKPKSWVHHGPSSAKCTPTPSVL